MCSLKKKRSFYRTILEHIKKHKRLTNKPALKQAAKCYRAMRGIHNVTVFGITFHIMKPTKAHTETLDDVYGKGWQERLGCLEAK